MSMALLLPLLSSLAPGLLSKLFGGKDPNQQYRQNVQNLLAPQNLARLTQGYYSQALGSPQYALGQRQIAAGTNATQNALAGNAAMSGVSNSGAGNLAQSIGPSLAGNQMAQLQAGMYGQAQNQAQNNIQQQIGALGGQMPVSQNMSLCGGGLAALGPLLQQLLSRGRGGMGGYPGYSAGGVQNQGQPQQQWS